MLLATLRFLLPFSYFRASRLTDGRTWISLLGFEWAPLVLVLLFLVEKSLMDIPASFALAYLAFIAIYEIGYLTNDVISIRFEDKPRRRLPNFDPHNAQLVVWILARIGAFTGITFLLEMQSDWRWWGFYGCLIVVFGLHNILKDYGLRVVTFVGLATARILAPVFPFLTTELLSELLLPLFLNYVLFRTLAYMESKGLLTIPDRATFRFRVGFYLSLLPVSTLIAITQSSPVAVGVTMYYLMFWSSLSVVKTLET